MTLRARLWFFVADVCAFLRLPSWWAAHRACASLRAGAFGGPEPNSEDAPW